MNNVHQEEHLIENAENFVWDLSDSSINEQYINERKCLLETLRPVLKQDPIACDFTLCLAISAIKSLRVNQIFHPRPKSLPVDSEGDLKNLRKLCDKVPPLSDIISKQDIPTNVLKFLHWLFITVHKQGTYLKTSYASSYPGCNLKIVQPNLVFNVIHTDSFNEKWEDLKGTRDTFFAFHGSPLENFFSISQTGLRYPMFDTKCRLYGDGIYLSTDITMCFLYSPFWCSWTNSKLKGRYSVVACCEIIDDDAKVLQEGVTVRTELDNRIAQKYVVVTDPSMIRISHFLVYEKPTNFLWIQNNIFLIIIFFYVMLLLYVGFCTQKATWFKYLYAICNRFYGFEN